MEPTLASTVLTKRAGFVFRDLGFFQDEIDLRRAEGSDARGAMRGIS
jgi:hypothetical protein